MSTIDAPAPPRRVVRSFVRREGRITPAQTRALEACWPRYGIEPPAAGARLDLAALFGRDAETVLEIGFGNGEHLLQLAQSAPERNFVGVEVHRPGVGRLLARAHEAQLANLRVASHDAVEVLGDWLAAESLDEILIFFPDPWPKKRHHKRRLIQPAFAQLLATRLRRGGTLSLATDWADYAGHMRGVLNAESALQNLAADGGFVARSPARAATKFETRGLKLGHGVFDLAYRKKPGP